MFSPLKTIVHLVSHLLFHCFQKELPLRTFHFHIPHHLQGEDKVPLIWHLLQLFLLAQPLISVQLLFEDSLLPPFEQLILLLQCLLPPDHIHGSF